MLLNVRDLKINAQFARGEGLIVKGASFILRSGKPLAIVGESGSGKTMCALALLGLLPDNCAANGSAFLCETQDGELSDKGVELIGMKERAINKLRGTRLVYIPQSGAEFLNPALKIKTQIYESLKKAGVKGKSALKAATVEKLNESGIEHAEIMLEKYPSAISGGEAQRVALAIAHCSRPALIIADEPTKGIDSQTARVFYDAIDGFKDACLIIITHDMELAKKCDSVLVLKDGEVQEYGETKTVFSSPKSDYTKRLLSDWAEADYA